MCEVFFVYGTLTDDEQVAGLLDSYRVVGDAVCVGLRRIDGRYPTLVPGGEVAGRLLSTPELDRLDRYEGVDRGLYCRVRVPLESASSDVSDSDHSVFDIETAAVYVAEPSKVGVGPEVGWPEAEGFSQSVTTYLGTNSVRITVEPATDDY